MEFSKEALSCGFFEIVNIVKGKYDKGNLYSVEGGIVHTTKKGTYTISENTVNGIKVNRKKYNIKRVKEILLNLDHIYDVGGFLEAWHEGALGASISNLNDEVIMDCFKLLLSENYVVNDTFLQDKYLRLYKQIEKRFGSIRGGYEYLGLDYDSVLLKSNQLYSIQGLIFENIFGEILKKSSIETLSQHDIAGDGSTRIDYYLENGNIGYECKLRDSTVFNSESIHKYAPLLKKLYIVYAIDTGRNKEVKQGNVELLHISEFLNVIDDMEYVESIQCRLDELLNIEVVAMPHSINTCEVCSNTFKTLYHSQKCCSNKCKTKRRNDGNKAKMVKKEVKVLTGKCPECDREFTTTSKSKIYCERKCGKRAWWRNNGNRYENTRELTTV